MDTSIKSTETASIWDLLELMRNVTIVILCFTIAIMIIFAVASALPAAWYWHTTRCSDGQIAYPFFIGLTDNVCWLTYGIYKGDWRCTALNIYCLSMTLFYITVMYIYRSNRNDMHRLMLGWIVVFLIMQGYLSQLETNEEAAKAAGCIITCVQTAGAYGLIMLLYKILKNWRLDFVPFYPVALGLCIEAQVFTLGVLTRDRYLMMANGFFLTMNAIIFALFWVLPANRQLVLPDLFTFLYERLKAVYAWYKKRRQMRKVYAAPSTIIVDVNENIVV